MQFPKRELIAKEILTAKSKITPREFRVRTTSYKIAAYVESDQTILHSFIPHFPFRTFFRTDKENVLPIPIRNLAFVEIL